MLTWNHLAVVLGFGLGLILVLRHLRERGRPSVTIAWLLSMAVVPYVAVPLYVLFGGRKMTRRLAEKRPLFGKRAELGPDNDASRVERVIINEGFVASSGGNHVELLPDGIQAYEHLCAMIESAEHTVHLATFILARDEVGRSLIELLARRAREGVGVYLLLDGLGSIWARQGDFLKPLREAGGHVGIFLPVLPTRRRWSANLRNHRKVTVVDGVRAWTGGMNLAREYMGPEPFDERWVDVAAELHGPIVRVFEDVFLCDWEFATEEKLEPPNVAPEKLESIGQAKAQVLASGPDVRGFPFLNALIAAIMEAQHRIWLVTPYYIPDEPLQRALVVRAKMGCDVLLVLPQRSNHPVTDFARGRFVRELRAAGGRISLVPQMVHAKAMVFDDELAVLGSANLDQRSLYLNFELSLFLYSAGEIDALATWIRALADKGTAQTDEAPGLIRGWLEDLSLLVTPLL